MNDVTMNEIQLNEFYTKEPWGKLAVEAGYDPINTESAARRAFEFCAKKIDKLEQRIKELEEAQ